MKSVSFLRNKSKSLCTVQCQYLFHRLRDILSLPRLFLPSPAPLFPVFSARQHAERTITAIYAIAHPTVCRSGSIYLLVDLRAYIARSLLLFVVDSVCLSVCLFVTEKLQIDSSFSFLDGIEPFLSISSPWPPLQNVVLRFLIYAPYRPKFTPPNLHKIAYKSACMADRPEIFAQNRGFSGMADSMESCKMFWGRLDPC